MTPWRRSGARLAPTSSRTMGELAATRAPELTYVGRVARRGLRDGARGRVQAVFDSSFYVALGDQWICLGPQALGPGPLNALWSAGKTIRFPAIGARVAVQGDTLTVGSVTFAHKRLGPEPTPFLPRPWTAGTLARGLRAFEDLAPPLAPAEGLACMICDQESPPPYAVAAVGPATHLEELVHRARECLPPRPDASVLAALLGLGPGLTPSGDDLLGGALATLAAVGLADLRDAVWASIAGAAPSLTNDIALAHLSAAAEGECAPTVTDAIDALLSGSYRQLSHALNGLRTIGHTSGWDALAGVVTVLRGLERALSEGDARCRPMNASKRTGGLRPDCDAAALRPYRTFAGGSAVRQNRTLPEARSSLSSRR